MNNPSINSESHSVEHYFKIWAVVLALFVISVTVAQISDNRPLVLMTAFGIAIVQAFLVASYFMHLNEEHSYVLYLLLSMVLVLMTFYVGSIEDVGHTLGLNWVASDSQQLIEQHKEAQVDVGKIHQVQQPIIGH